MSYFSSLYPNIKYPKSKPNQPVGLRNAQIGAIHAIGQHFTLYENEPALIVMPTGSGKTAVLSLSPYLLEANRVLVVSSSRLVRGQIYNELKELKTLRKIGVFAKDVRLPKCKEVVSGLNSIEEWNDLKNYDFSIGLPNSLTTGLNDGINPPTDIFDLILVDESHHIPASTWTLITDYFKDVKKIYFTATPFRRDKKEIKSRLAYSYPLSRAYEDKIFGKVGYYGVKAYELKRAEKDKLIAIKAEEIFNEDKKRGFEHFLMVRTNHKSHANELKKIYEENTGLNLMVIHSNHTFRHVKSAINKLKNKKLDGVICVNMLAEGFDFPNLKIAAIHEHHKSLAVTLQFIGRFARTNAPNIGEAKFIAAENDIVLGQKHLLYQDGAIWSDIIVNLSEQTIADIREVQEFNSKFIDRVGSENPRRVNFSLSVLKPYSHIKIFRTKEFDLDGVIDIGNQQIIFHRVDESDNATVFITEKAVKPKWIQIDDIKDTQYFLYILYYDKNTHLLYVHFSGKKTNVLFETILECFGVTDFEVIPKSDIHKALYGLRDMTFFNIGLQSRAVQTGESYRTISGSAAHNRISNSEGRMYSSGHVQGSGIDERGIKTTIGYSSGSKVWSSKYINLKDFIFFCKLIGKKINSDVIVKTNTSLDNIPIPKQIAKLPSGEKVSFVTWHNDTFKENPLTLFSIDGEEVYNGRLIDLGLFVDYSFVSEDSIQIILKSDEFEIPIEYSFNEGYKYILDNEFNFLVHYGDDDLTKFLKYLTNYPLSFQLTDLSTIANGNELLVRTNKAIFNLDRLEPIKWDDYNTDISQEYKNPAIGKRHVHDVLCEILINKNPTVLIYDHGSHEVADFILLRESTNIIKIELYHVKAADNESTGDRVSYLYEVCGQAEKSLIYTKNKTTFKNKILSRVELIDGEVKLLGTDSKIKYGTLSLLTNILNSEKQFNYEIFAVQPGLSKANISVKLSHLLASTDDYISSNANNEKLRVWCSK